MKNGIPTDYPGVGNSCSPLQANNAFVAVDYHVPTSSSGVGDLPGGNFMVTLGLWDALNGVGTIYNQAATTFHELGHNLNLWHGGVPALFGKRAQGATPSGDVTYVEPNCKPNYQSTMSYMFQGHGLITTTGAAVLDYSDQLLGNLDETALNDGAFINAVPKYRPTWFAPAGSTLAGTLGVLPATRLCNGVKFQELIFPPGSPSPAMARVWVQTPVNNTWNVAIDWHGDGVGEPDPDDSNVNFDGLFRGGQVFSDAPDVLFQANDWAPTSIRLDSDRRRQQRRRSPPGRRPRERGYSDIGFRRYPRR